MRRTLPIPKPLDPKEFCDRYCRLQPGDWGYRAGRRRLLAKVFGEHDGKPLVSENAVKQWETVEGTVEVENADGSTRTVQIIGYGNCPEDRRRYLSAIHGLAQNREILQQLGVDDLLK